MASSLHKLLSEEVQKSSHSQKPHKNKTPHHQDSITLPIFICYDRRASKPPSATSSTKSYPEPNPNPFPSKTDPAPIDEVAVRALVSILAGHVGRYLKDGNFRRTLREKCSLCFQKGSLFDRFEIGVDGIDRLVESRDMDLERLQESIRIFKNVSEDPNPDSRAVAACARLYLSIVYKFSKNDKICANQLLNVFVDSPFLARTRLLPELWDHVFLPHLLHIKIWRQRELCFSEGEEGMVEALNDQYNYHMDVGTAKFALYYREWLTFGGRAPSVPSVALPSRSRSSSSRSRRRSADSVAASFHGESIKKLYRTVFGHSLKGRSMDMDNGGSDNVWDLEVEEGYDENHVNHVGVKKSSSRRNSSSSLRYNREQKVELWPESRKSDYLRLLGCRADSSTVHGNYVSNNDRIGNDRNAHLPHNSNGNITRAIATICSSESLFECEKAIRSITEAWLNSHSDKSIETLLSQASAIQGIMEVLYVSTNDEILELAISLVAELAARNEINRLMILNSDPQLDVLMKLLRSSSLFLKSAALLYLIKPKAKQMVLMEWVPLVLRVLEFGEQSQILFTVRCDPKEAAYYLLDELLTGFDEDKNLENARQIVSLGGLSLLVRRMDEGGIFEKRKACAVLHYCIKADGSCRYYVAKNLKKETIIALLALGTNADSREHALGLLTELVCLSRRNQITEFLNGLRKGWDCLNTMQALLILLQRARPEERPVIAVILLQIDLMDDTIGCSVYREEAVDTIIKALDCWVFDEVTQELSARALLILGGRFSYIGEPDVERWLLRKAGHDETNPKSSLRGKNISTDGQLSLNEDEKNSDSWQRKIATVLLTSGNRRLFASLSDSIANSIPCLARASLVTVCWMSISLHSLGDKDGLQLRACSIMIPPLIDCLNDSASIEEKILASFSLYNLTKGTDYFSRLSRLEKEVLGRLRKLSRVTWTAKELISEITSSLPDRF